MTIRLFTLLIVCSALTCLSREKPSVEAFVRELLANSPTLERFVHPPELQLARRLGITYNDAKQKFLIGFDFDEETKTKLRSGTLNHNASTETLEDGFSKLTVELVGNGTKKSFYFKQSQLVSPVWYFARNWKRIKSKHFSFWVSDTNQFHQNAIVALEHFFDEAARLLQFSKKDLSLLEKQKIIYVFCKDEEEIERLTGYKTRGIYLMSYDYVVTTYSCHFHEVLHLLMNFKLKQAPLFVHPLLQEGFAVAYGSRGGIALNTILQSGVFLHDTKFLEYRELLAAKNSLQQDASLTYPVSGLYVRFLLQTIGLQKFLALYKNYSATLNGLSELVISENDLPPQNLWQQFVDSTRTRQDVVLDSPSGSVTPLLADSLLILEEQGEFYRVRMKSNFMLHPTDVRPGYMSKKFKELLPQQHYRGEQYLFMADTNEVTVSDLYANTSIAGFSSGFSSPPRKVRQENGWLEFWVKRDVFGSLLRSMRVVRFE